MPSSDTQFKPGNPGRKAGVLNKRTLAIVQATRDYQIAEHAAQIAGTLFGMLATIQASYPDDETGRRQFAKDPTALAVAKEAFDSHHKLLEFAFPKLRRTEYTGDFDPDLVGVEEEIGPVVRRKVRVALRIGDSVVYPKNGHTNGGVDVGVMVEHVEAPEHNGSSDHDLG